MKSWPNKRLGEATRVLSGATPKTGVAEYWNGDLLWVTPKDLGALETVEISTTERTITRAGFESCSAQLVPPKSVVMSSRAPIGHLAINTLPVCTNQGCKSFVPSDALDVRFLFWTLRAFMTDIQHLGDGCTFDEVSKTDLERFEIPVPPLAEQRRIVARIEALTCRLEQARQTRQAAISEAATVFESTLKSAFAELDKEDLGEALPFDKAVERIQPRVKLKTVEYRDTGALPIVDQGQKLICGFTDNASDCFQGPLPVVVFGDHTRIVKHIDFDFAVGADGAVLLRPRANFTTKYLAYWLQSRDLHNLGYSRHFKLLREETIRFPRDTAEQEGLTARLDALRGNLDELERLQREVEAELASFRPALLSKIFRGEL